MDSLVVRLSPVLHLTRITHAVAAVGNVWFVLLWTRAVEADRSPQDTRIISEPLWTVLSAGAVLGVALFAFAMIVHDAYDERRDRTMSPDRPLASGAISHASAIAIATLSLLASVVAGAWLGDESLWIVCAVAAGVVIYHSAFRAVPSIGLVFIGLIYAGHMVSPNPRLGFMWPVVWAMTHALLVGLMAHRLADRRPALDGRALFVSGMGWGVWSMLLLSLGRLRTGSWWPEGVPPWTIGAQLLLIGVFAGVAWRKASRTRSRARSAEKVRRYGALWQPLYAVVWCLGAALWDEAMVLGVLAGIGFLTLTFLREIYSLIEQPVGYRR